MKIVTRPSFKLLLVLLSIFKLSVAHAADIDIIKNPYEKLKHAVDFGDLQQGINKQNWDSNTYAMLNQNELALDEHQGCEQLKFALNWDRAIRIRGEIYAEDGAKFRDVLQKSLVSARSSLDQDCGLPVIIDSVGGNLEAALDIGHQIHEKPRFVIVPPEGNCLSACVFILLAARYEDANFSFSKAVAFDSSNIGVHWPQMSDENLRYLQTIAATDPQMIFKFFGGTWENINNYSLQMTGSTWFSSALLRSLSLPKGQLYMVNSSLERQIAGINQIILNRKAESLGVDQMDNSVLRNVCLSQFVTSSSLHLPDIAKTEIRKNNMYIMYYPYDRKVCFARIENNKISIIYRDFESPSDSSQSDNADAGQEEKLPAIKAYLWNTLKGVGITKDAVGTSAGIGKSIESLSKDDIHSAWTVFGHLSESYKCVECGNFDGTILFSNDENNCQWGDDYNLSKSKKYVNILKRSGFGCQTILNDFILSKMLFEVNDLFENSQPVDIEIAYMLPIFDRNRVNIQSTCGNIFGVCSAQMGSFEEGQLTLKPIEVEEPSSPQ